MSLCMTSHLSLRVFMPVQRARHSWATSPPLHSPPQQAAEDHPCIPAPATAAYRLWAGEHMQSHTRVYTIANTCTQKLVNMSAVVGCRETFGDIWPYRSSRIYDISMCGWREFVIIEDGKIYFNFTRKQIAEIKALSH